LARFLPCRFTPLFKFWAGGIILLALLVIGVLVTFDVPLACFCQRKEHHREEKVAAPEPMQLKISSPSTQGFISEKVGGLNRAVKDEEEEEEKPESVSKQTVINAAQKTKAPLIETLPIERKDWKLPAFDLLDDNHTEVDSGNIEANVAIIKKLWGISALR